MNTDAEICPDGTACQVSGPQDAPPLILIHGLGLTRSTWDGMIPALSANHRVIRYDLFGHGESAQPPRAPDLTLFSEQCIALMDHLGVARAAIIGFSLGGMINRRMAIDHPDLVSRLVVLNSPHERGEEKQALVEQQARDSSAGGPAATIDAALERWFTPQFRKNHAPAVHRVRDDVLANDPQAYAACRYVLANGVVELIRPDPPIQCPALVITCENDSGSTPAMAQAIASEISGSRLQIASGLRHMGLVEQPGIFADAILAFLAD